MLAVATTLAALIPAQLAFFGVALGVEGGYCEDAGICTGARSASFIITQAVLAGLGILATLTALVLSFRYFSEGRGGDTFLLAWATAVMLFLIWLAFVAL